MSPETNHLAALSLFLQAEKWETCSLLLLLQWGVCVCVREITCGILSFYKIPKGNYVANDSEMKGDPISTGLPSLIFASLTTEILG